MTIGEARRRPRRSRSPGMNRLARSGAWTYPLVGERNAAFQLSLVGHVMEKGRIATNEGPAASPDVSLSTPQPACRLLTIREQRPLADTSGLLAKPPPECSAGRPGKFLVFSRARQLFSVVCGGIISLQRGGFESSPHILRPPLADVTRADK